MTDFMQHDIDHFDAYIVETTAGTEIIPYSVLNIKPNHPRFTELLTQYLGGEPKADPELVTGWYARLSAPGYLDCTEWHGPFSTQKGARDYITEVYELED